MWFSGLLPWLGRKAVRNIPTCQPVVIWRDLYQLLLSWGYITCTCTLHNCDLPRIGHYLVDSVFVLFVPRSKGCLVERTTYMMAIRFLDPRFYHPRSSWRSSLPLTIVDSQADLVRHHRLLTNFHPIPLHHIPGATLRRSQSFDAGQRSIYTI